ncbi:translation initiation factor IF-2 [Geobacter argillaceus]|uniref:Translation initiation factor IF-2 n=1 Tax=Geobacter argillaceus TaxID=345631 RepID=A0A562VPB2_9BACT|nr:translation initiation factor IF-2 [Geobacter argillaceus]TWJ19662.1 translation initiation factor 2 (bIF-2) [Geobacter argillaceus]
MGKIRVYELAQKMGIENKELMAKLQAIGVDVKSHSATLDEADVNKLLAPPPQTATTTVQDVQKEEVRVSTSVIRRRPKTVEKQVDVEVVPPPEPTPEPTPVPVAVEPAEAPAPEKKVMEKPTGGEAAALEQPAPAPTPASVPTPEKVVVKEEKSPTPPPEPQRPTANRAVILGRVELPGLTTPARQSASPQPGRTERPASMLSKGRPQAERGRDAAPAPRGQDRPTGGAPRVVTPAPAEAPPGAADRKGGKKGPPTDAAKSKKGGTPDKRKEGIRRAELEEKRERVFEPGFKAGKGKKKYQKERVSEGKKTEITTPKAIKRIIKISETISVGELAKRMGIKATDLIRALMKMGMMATINHPLDFDTATLLATDFGYEIENVAVDLDEILESVPDAPESLVKRSPVVTIMGHVDHGKTSLLDAIREANVIAGEAGGITQHIGAYDVELNGRKITFLDTPGHEAFTAMRARGAKVTDIVILVVAADDGVMPQTREAINHSKAAGVPIIVAINKIDKPDAKPERVKQELTEHGLVSEEWGGDTTMVEVSAKKRLNLESLLEMVLLQADVMELKANPDKPAKGTIVEAKLDKGRGPVATVLVQEGTLKMGDYCVVGVQSGRVRAMQNDRGEKVLEAGPSMPVEVIGLSGVPDAGDVFVAMKDEKQAKEIATLRQIKQREVELAKHTKLSLEDLYKRIQSGEVKDLNVIVKGDVQGSVEAVGESLRKLSTDAVRLNVIHSAVGAVTETDVNLAAASNAIIIGFNVRPEVKAQNLAEKEGVDIRLYSIIYDAVEDVKKAMEGLLEPIFKEKYLGRAEIREVFSVPKVGNVAGCYVQDGKVVRNAQVRLLRDNVVIYTGKMSSLRRFKDDVKDVATGYECGIGLENYNDLKIGDIIEAFEMEKVAATL